MGGYSSSVGDMLRQGVDVVNAGHPVPPPSLEPAGWAHGHL